MKFLGASSAVTLAALILVTTGGVAVAQTTQNTGTVVGDTVNFRSGPSKNYRIVGQLKRGDSVVVSGRKGDWLRIQAPKSTQVWVSAPFVDAQGKVLATRINVRPRPTTRYAPMGQAIRGQRLTVLERKKGWARIATPGGLFAYVHRNFVKTSNKIQILKTTGRTSARPPLVTTRAPFTTKTRKARKVATQRKRSQQFDPARSIYDRALKNYKFEVRKDISFMNFSGVINDLVAVSKMAKTKSLVRRSDFTLRKARKMEGLRLNYRASMDKVNKLLKQSNERLTKHTQATKPAIAIKPRFNNTMTYKPGTKKRPITVKKATRKVSALAVQPYIAVGWVDDMGYTLGQDGTHKLVKGEKVYYLLKSGIHDLDQFIGKRVGLRGKVLKSTKGQEDVIQVESIDLLMQ